MSGDDLVRPLNAPSGQPTAYGTQPGVSSAVILANRVIIYGPADGLFVYNGAPAFGSLTESIAAMPGNDQFGNAYLGGSTTYLNGIFALSTQSAGILGYTAPGPGGPWTLSGAEISFSTDGAIITVFGTLLAESGTPAAPSIVTTDIWNTVTPPTGTSGTLQYRMTADQMVEVVCQLAVTTSVSASNPLTLIGSLAADYTAAVTTRGPVGYFINGTPTLAQLQAICDMRWSADTAGTFTIRGWVGGAANSGITELDLCVRYPLTSPPPPPYVPNGPGGSWNLVFDEEFAGNTLDTTKWLALDNVNLGGFTAHAANAVVSGGYLVMTMPANANGAQVTTASSAALNGPAGVNSWYLPVGGCVEARINFAGNGTQIWNWPAWWVCGANWPAAGEHDICEGDVSPPAPNYHGPGVNEAGPQPPGNWTNGFHTFTLVRGTPGVSNSEWYWDGTLVWSWMSNDNGGPQWLILTAGGVGTYPEFGSASTIYVDYVRGWTPL